MRLAENYEFFLTHSHLTPSVGVNSFEFVDEVWYLYLDVYRHLLRIPS